MSNSPISVIFAGTPEIAAVSLQALIDDPAFEVVLVITQPDKPIGRKKVLEASPVKDIAQAAGIEVAQPNTINNEWTKSQITNHKSFDFLVVVAYGQILSQEILDAPEIAAVNLHPSLLPRWRGPSPMKSALLAGDTETGVTIQQMVKKLDAGAILSQVTTPIDAEETITTLQDRLTTMGATLLVETLKAPLKPVEQNDDAVTRCHMLDRTTGDIDPATLSVVEVHRTVRALVPWPGVRVHINNQGIKLLKTSLTETADSIELQCKDGILHILELQPPGKKQMTGKAWQRGLH